MVNQADARLTVVHVMEHALPELPELYQAFTANQQVSVADYRTRALAAMREQLELAVPAAAREYCKVETVLTDGKAYRESSERRE